MFCDPPTLSLPTRGRGLWGVHLASFGRRCRIELPKLATVLPAASRPQPQPKRWLEQKGAAAAYRALMSCRGLVPGIQPRADTGARGELDSGDKRRNDTLLC